jgi:LmbE family N-acetylglucosaminyl deacetylase
VVELEHLADAVVDGRVLVVAAHPDDETIGAAGLLCRARDPWVVHVTDGVPADPRLRTGLAAHDPEAYRLTRRAELDAALDLAGVPVSSRLRVGLVDQEVALCMLRATRALRAVFERVAPVLIVTHPYEGGHPDHDATAFACAFACRCALARSGIEAHLVEMTSYHARDGRLATGEFLGESGPVVTVEHDAALRGRKRAMLDCHVSQRQILGPFGVERERFRIAPRYRFDAPAHRGMLHYESLGWPMTGARFADLARLALAEPEMVEGVSWRDRRASGARSRGSSG